jgi:branched-subunit amino acid transport protein
MTPAWTLVLVVFFASVAMKAVGPATLGSTRPSARTASVISLLPPALLAALVIYATFGSSRGPGLSLDARLAGLVAAIALLALRLPLLVVVVGAAAATALARLLAS